MSRTPGRPGRAWRAWRSAVPRILALATGLAAPFAAACGGSRQVATNLADAARATHLPHVVACWEKQFEGAQFRGSYLATVDFAIEGSTSRLHEAKVRSLQTIDEEGKPLPDDPGDAEATSRGIAFRACVEQALDETTLPTTADADGPGFAAPGNLAVKSFRIAFVDASSRKRTLARSRQGNVLLGPRADRCAGLYGHEPPRNAPTIYEDLSRDEARAAAPQADLDAHARDLQKLYDGQLELRDRLARDLGAPDLPAANRERLQKALDESKEAARKTGRRIGCVPPG